jgi:uncharacterized membrane protein HdeD (DUF308 family)
MIKIHRGEMIAVAVVGLALGVVALLWPAATLLTVALLFGTYLVFSGIFRITAAFVADQLSTGLRWFSGLMGVVITLAGIFCLSNPFGTLIGLAFVIGIGWIAEGFIDISVGLRRSGSARWLAVVSGVVSIFAGILAFILPAALLPAFVLIGAVLLIAVSLTTLLTLPRSTRPPRDPR